MNKEFNRVEKLIEELCPDGVEYRRLSKLANITIGEFVHKNKQNPKGLYPVYNGGISETGFYDEYNNTGNKILVSARGANAGYVNKIFRPYWAGNSSYSIDVTSNLLDWNFAFYYLKQNQNSLTGKQQKGGIPAVSKKQIEDFLIPLPPLPIQQEIVSILDKFTELEVELEAELEARKKQYEYYREKLMKISDKVAYKQLGDVSIVTKLAGYEFTEHVKYANEGKIIALRGLNIKKGRLDTTNVKFIDGSNFSKLNRSKLFINDLLFTYVGTIGEVALVDEDDKYYLAPNVALIRFTDERINPVFMRYYFQSSYFIDKQINRYLSTSSMKNLTMQNIRKFEIPILSKSEQEESVYILDKLDALVNNLKIGLPAELSARRQQYEYYRNKLLTFKEKSNEK